MRIKTIAIHEFLFTIKRKTFYLVTLGMPLIVLAYGGLVALIAFSSASSELRSLGKPIAVVDRSGILTGPGGDLHDLQPGAVFEYESKPEDLEALMPARGPGVADLPIPKTIYRLLRFEALSVAQQALADGTVRAVVVVPEDYIASGTLQHFTLKRDLLSTQAGLGFLGRLLGRNILRRAQLPPEAIARVQRDPAVVEYEQNPDGAFEPVNLYSKWFSLGMPLGISGLLLIALMMNAGLLLASVAEEKENKVMEVILSSVSAEQLLFGKVLGLVAAGVLQILVWLAMVGVVPILTMTLVREHFDYDIHWVQMGIGCLFVLLGLVFYGCLLAGLGSMGSTYKDCQQLTVSVILCACVPFMAIASFASNPDGWVARLLSWIPLFSPGSMMLRTGLTVVPWWDVGLSLILLLGGIWLATKVSARWFRAGTLMVGKKPGIREIWQALRQSA